MSLRDGPLGDIKVPLAWGATITLIVAVVFTLALVLGDRRETMRAEAYDKTRGTFDRVAAPVGGVVSAPVGWARGGFGAVGAYFFAASQNRRLKQELAEAAKWHDEVIALREENARYRVMMGVKTDPPIPMVFAQTVSDSRGPFANTRLANVGAERGVAQGNPVLGQHGLVGRIVGVSRTASRILLLTDMESRTPVLTPRTNARAILIGDGGPNPKLAYLRTHDPLREGDRVLTSGDGGVFPRGLPVGVVVKGFDGSWRVALDADSAPIDYVQIMLFKDFAQLIDAAALTPRSLPGAMAEAPNESILGKAPTPAKPAKAGAAATAAGGAAKPATAATPPTVTVTMSTGSPPPKPKPKPKPKPPTLHAPKADTSTDTTPPY